MTTIELAETMDKIAEHFVNEGSDNEVADMTCKAIVTLFDLVEFTEEHSLFELYDSLGCTIVRTPKEDAIYQAAAALLQLKAIDA